MKRQAIFDCKEHQEYGGLGWVLQNMPAFDPLPGMAVAHDMLEHIPDDDSTTGELMALGAFLYVRGEEYFQQKRRGMGTTSPAENCHGEIGDLLIKIHYKEWVPLQATRHTLRGLPGDIQDEIKKTVRLVRRYLKTERDDYTMTAEDSRAILGWMAEGYRQAAKRYSDLPRYELLDLFCRIEAAADKALKQAEEGTTRLHVHVDTTSGRAELNVYTSDVYEDDFTEEGDDE